MGVVRLVTIGSHRFHHVEVASLLSNVPGSVAGVWGGPPIQINGALAVLT